jgi:hypothetical protein
MEAHGGVDLSLRTSRSVVEKYTVASIMAFPSLLQESGIRPEHFSDELVAKIAAALPLCSIRNARGEMNAHEVCRLVGTDYENFHKFLGAAVFNIEQGRGICRQLRDLASRDLLAMKVQNAILHPMADAEVTEELLSRLELVVSEFRNSEEQSEELISAVTESYIRQVELELETGRRMGLTTGLRFIDEIMGGLNCGELTTLVAAGGVGKSTVAMDMPRRVARNGATVLYWSAEMTRRQVGQREVHAVLGLPIRGLKLTAFNLHEGRQAMDEQSYRDRIILRFGSRVRATDLLAAGRQVQAKHGGLGMIVLDHLGFFDAERPKAGEQEQIAAAVQQCKGISQILDVPFVLVTHLNRAGLIRGSERIKDTSDNVIELKRDEGATYTVAKLMKARQTGETHKEVKLEYSSLGQTFTESAWT